MKRKFRLKRTTDFERVRRFGESYAHPLVVLIAQPNELDHTRCGIIAGRSIGNAVRRNRAKRLLRAAAQPLISQISPGFDIILIARKPLVEADLKKVQEALENVIDRASLRRID